MTNRLPLSIALTFPLVFAACGGGLTLPPEGEAANITVVDGNGQSGRVGTTLSKPLRVQVTDTRDRPVAGATVLFSFPSAAAGEAAPASVTSDADGYASSTLRLGSAPGTVTGRVEVPVAAGITPVQATFTATALSDDANGISAVSGDNQSGPVNSALPAPLVVKVTDQFGNPVAGITITWSVAGGGSVSEVSTVTNAEGQAAVTRTLGSTAGQQTASATAEGLAGSPVVFTHTATAGSATGVVKVSGDNQSGSPGALLDQPLVVQVLDGEGNPIPNRAVTWVIGTGNGSVAPENTTTDAQGNASTRWTLGPGVGGNTVNAVVSGVGTATFSATATAGAPSAGNSEVSASPATISAGSGTSTITVVVRDASNNPVAGALVTLESSGSGNTITPGSASSGPNGVATFSFSSTVAETKTITATAGGVVISDQATVTVQKVSSIIEITSDEPDPSTVGQAVRVEFTVSGSGGTPAGTVTVTVSGGPETCTETLSGGSGSCEVTMLLPGTGSNRRRVITASYSGDARFAADFDTENHRVDVAPNPNTPPTAAFNAPTDCVTGQPCQFNDASTDSDGTIASRLWAFQDGSPASSEQANPAVTFASPGSKSVTLTVEDDDGATSSVTRTVTIGAANAAPTASFTPPTDCVAGQPCQFTDASTDSDGTISAWTWTFQDGTPPSSDQQNPAVTFASSGPKTVGLTVTDNGGAQSSVSREVQVQAPPGE